MWLWSIFAEGENFMVLLYTGLAIFITVYAILTFGYLIYRYLFAVIHSFEELRRHHRIDKSWTPKVSIVIPCYNEIPGDLEKCIVGSCENSYPNKEVIVIDDGSKSKECWVTIKKLQKKYRFKAIKFIHNRGKRDGMTVGFKEATGEFIITMDSDSIIFDENSIYELIHPFNDPKVGAVSGNVQVLNKEKTLMTRIQWARYWLAFNIEKSSQSPYDGVTCCSGPFSAYRREYVMEYLDKWSNQYFLGSRCTYGDDRGLTTMMLGMGYKVRFSKYALCVTNVPETLKQFTKQQIRWKKSFIRENYFLSKFLYKLNFMMKVEFVWFWTIFLMGFLAKIIAIGMLLTGNLRLTSFAIMIIFVSMAHYFYAFVRKPGRMGFYGILYGFLNEFWIMWLFWYALFTLKENSWGTR